MPHFVRRDIFAFAKVILRLRRSDILFASLTAVRQYHSAESRISLRSNRTRRKANRTEKSTYKNVSEKLIITRNRVVAKQSRCEGVYNRTGDLSVICFGEEEQRNECEAIKNRRKRYVACDDVAGVAESDKASLVACNNLYVPFASQKMD